MLSSILKVLSRLNRYISSGRLRRCDFICPPFTDIVLFFLNDRIPYGHDSDHQLVSEIVTGAFGSIYDEGHAQNAFETIHSQYLEVRPNILTVTKSRTVTLPYC